MNKKILSILALGSAALAITGGEGVANFVNAMSIDDVHVSDVPIVKYGENGEVLKINDPDDPKNSILTNINIRNKQILLFVSKNGDMKESEQINFEVLPYGASTAGFTYTSSNPSVATVSETGLVQAVAQGKCDITLSNATGTIKSISHVVVNEKINTGFDSRISQIQTSQRAMNLSTIFVEEQYIGSKTNLHNVSDSSDDEVVERTQFVEKFWCSKEQNYFRITSEELAASTQDGNMEQDRVDFIFYTAEDYMTYVFSTNGNVKHYMRVNQRYIHDRDTNNTRYDALCEVIGNFFTSGRKIIDQQFSLVTGADYFSKNITLTKNDNAGALNEAGQLGISYLNTFGEDVDKDDADDFGVPVGTHIDVIDNIRYSWENSLVTRKHIVETLKYEKDGDKYNEVYNVDYYFDTENVELLYPTISEYTKVDDIYGL